MHTALVVLAVLSLFVAALVALAGLLLAWSFFSSHHRSDRWGGVLLVVLSLVWLALPAAGTWLCFWTARHTLGGVLLAVGLVASVAALPLAAGAIEAGARP